MPANAPSALAQDQLRIVLRSVSQDVLHLIGSMQPEAQACLTLDSVPRRANPPPANQGSVLQPDMARNQRLHPGPRWVLEQRILHAGPV